MNTQIELVPGMDLYVTISDGTKMVTNNMVFVGLINFGLPCIVGKKTGIAVDTTIIIPMSQIMQIHFDEKLTLSKL